MATTKQAWLWKVESNNDVIAQQGGWTLRVTADVGDPEAPWQWRAWSPRRAGAEAMSTSPRSYTTRLAAMRAAERFADTLAAGIAALAPGASR